MVSQELLAILVCPKDRTPLAPAEPAVLERLNRAIEAGTLVNRAGNKIESPLVEGLLRQDGKLLYPVIDDIPVMLVDEAIEVEGAIEGEE